MKNEEYWKNRAAWNMYHYMEEAEKTADLISEIYRRASNWLTLESQGIFEKYMTKHKLSEQEARTLLNTLRDKASMEEMIQKLKNGATGSEKQELIKRLEAPAYRYRIERLQELQSQLDSVMQTVYEQEVAANTEFYAGLARESYYRSIFEIQRCAGAAFSFANISSKQIDKVLSMNWSSRHYSKRIWKNTEDLADEIKKELVINLITGRTEKETAEMIAYKFAKGAGVARRLVRTESCFIAGELTAKAYEECGVDKYIYIATLDLKTSEMCRELDGKIFDLSQRQQGKNYPPMHPWCRSTTIAYLGQEALSKLTRSFYNPKTRKTERVPMSMTYKEWYEKYVEGDPERLAEEHAIKNRSGDRKQYETYKTILGKELPDTFTRFQEMKYNEPEKWQFTKLDYQRRKELLEHPEMKLPNAENAVLPEGKFTKYLFGGNNADGLPKGKNFDDRLGYNIENWKELQKELRKRASLYPATNKGNAGFGEKYEQKMILPGLKGKPANVVVGWIHKPDGVTSMTSAYIKEV